MHERRRRSACFLGGSKSSGKRGVDEHNVDGLSVQFGHYIVGQA
ncbi:MAG: hypothetical protein ACLP36_13880 [Acidimicrobiales bacterium]|jgi:hypothetical protein